MAKVGRMVKESMVQEVASCFSERPNFFVTTFTRLPASAADSLRSKLHASQGHLVVIKRRLGLLATQPLNIQGLAVLLEGSVGFVLAGGDILHTAKLLVEFRKTHEGQLTLRGAVIDGQLLDLARVEELAQLPPKPVLRAQVAATIESPITGLMWMIEQLIGDLAWIAEQAAAQKPATEAGTPPTGGVAEGSAEGRSPRPTEPGTPPTGGVAEGSPDAVPRQESGRRPEESRDAAGGGAPTAPPATTDQPPSTKPEEGTPA